MTFKQIYEAIFKNKHDDIFCTDNAINENFSLTFDEYKTIINLVSNNLWNLLPKKENNRWIVLKLESNIYWYAIFFGLLKQGYNVLLLDPACEDKLENHYINQIDAIAIVDKFGVTKNGYNYIDYTKLISEKVFHDEAYDNWSDKIALCTSGTTGLAKIIGFSASDIMAQLSNTVMLFEKENLLTKSLAYYKKPFKILATVPTFHILGFFMPLMLWANGFSIILPRNLAPTTLINTVLDYNCIGIYAVPLLWQTIDKIMEKKPSIRNKISKNHILGLSGGASISKGLIKKLSNKGFYIINAYGLTETGFLTINLYEDKDKRENGACGFFLNGIDYNIGQKGELFINSKGTSSFTIKDKKEIKTDKDKFIDTGDICKVENNQLYILARSKEVIITSAGENIYPDELEEVISPLRELCEKYSVFEYKDSVALIISKFSGNKDDTISYINEVNKDMPVHKRIKYIFTTYDDLPLTSVGKINRNKIHDMLNSDKVDKLDIGNEFLEYNYSKIRNDLLSIIDETLDTNLEIEDNVNIINAYDINSFEIIEIFMKLEKKYNIVFDSLLNTKFDLTIYNIVNVIYNEIKK